MTLSSSMGWDISMVQVAAQATQIGLFLTTMASPIALLVLYHFSTTYLLINHGDAQAAITGGGGWALVLIWCLLHSAHHYEVLESHSELKLVSIGFFISYQASFWHGVNPTYYYCLSEVFLTSQTLSSVKARNSSAMFPNAKKRVWPSINTGVRHHVSDSASFNRVHHYVFLSFLPPLHVFVLCSGVLWSFRAVWRGRLEILECSSNTF